MISICVPKGIFFKTRYQLDFDTILAKTIIFKAERRDRYDITSW